jgi:hypothetical protein
MSRIRAERLLADARQLIAAGRWKRAVKVLKKLVGRRDATGMAARRLLAKLHKDVAPATGLGKAAKPPRHVPSARSAIPDRLEGSTLRTRSHEIKSEVVRRPREPGTLTSRKEKTSTRKAKKVVSKKPKKVSGRMPSDRGDSELESLVDSPRVLLRRPRIGDLRLFGGAGDDRSERAPRKKGTQKNATRRNVDALSGTRSEAQPNVIERTPHMDLPTTDALRAGSTFEVVVYVDQLPPKAGETATSVLVELPAGQSQVDVDVWVSGTAHFDVPRSSQRISLEVGVPRSTSVRFRISVKTELASVETARLSAYFTHQGRPVGQVSRPIVLVSSRRSSDPAPLAGPDAFQIHPGAPEPDLTVIIKDPDNNQQRLKCRIHSPHLPDSMLADAVDWMLPTSSDVLVRGYMSQFIEDKSGLALRGAGQAIFDAAPNLFREAYWSLIDRGKPARSILVVSEERSIPWELMVPSRIRKAKAREIRKALGVECRMGRWIGHEHSSPPASVHLRSSLVIAPEYTRTPAPLSKATEEVRDVLAVVPGTSMRPVTLNELQRLLPSQTGSLWHFVCHGAENGIGSHSLFLDAGTEQLTSDQLRAIDGIDSAFEARPFVFLNACEVGRPSIALVGAAGFPAILIYLGASAVLAPLWSVLDTAAYEVAAAFYGALASVRARGEAMYPAEILRRIRARAYETSVVPENRDSYAAYAFYGDPNAKFTA